MIRFAFYLNSAAVGFDDPFGDGKAKSYVPSAAGSCRVVAIKTLEDILLSFLRNPNTRISYGESHRMPMKLDGHHNTPFNRRILDCIVEQDHHQLLQTSPVGANHHIRHDLER